MCSRVENHGRCYFDTTLDEEIVHFFALIPLRYQIIVLLQDLRVIRAHFKPFDQVCLRPFHTTEGPVHLVDDEGGFGG